MFLRLKYERLKRQWSQADVARLAPPLTQSDISKIEAGRLIPTPDQLQRLGLAFLISPAHVLLKPVAVRDPEEVVHEEKWA